ncbi:MAG: hypothetical protein V4772_11730 [Pseudomonadota bacterium]
MNLKRPTVMPSGQSAQNAVNAPPLPRAIPTRLPAPVQAPNQTSPRRLDGISRRGLQLSIEQIRSRFPALGADAALQIQQLLQATVPETLTRRQATDWGVTPQRRYAEVVEKTLQLNQHPQRLAAQQHLQRLFVLLQEVFDAIDHQLQPGLLARWRSSPWQVLLKHQSEIELLRQALADAADALANQLETLQALQKELITLTSQLLTNALAASLLAEQLKPDLASALLQRAAELQQMHSHISNSIHQRDQSLADLQTLNACIQHAVLMLLPAWLDKTLHTSRNNNNNANPTVMLQQQQDLDVLLRAIRTA